ncbi:TPA: ABC transporter substrate-binding protein [Vibrio parahaemolyticus]
MNDVKIRYLELLHKNFDIHLPYPVSLNEMEVTLCTSRRNASTILKQLSDIGWIEWEPTVGRSNSSQLTVKKSLQQAINELLVSELNKGSLKLVSRLIELYGLTAARGLTFATEHLNLDSKLKNSVPIASYPQVNTIDPVKTFRHSELHLARSVYDVLLTRDACGKLQPSLAHHWEMKDKVMKLWLRPGVYRHDGDLLNIKDVAWSIRRLIEEDNPVQELWQCVKRVDVLESDCLVITLRYANKFLPDMLSVHNASIVCREKQLFDGQYYYHIGTGPFKIENWSTDGIQLRAHKDYFATRPLLERIALLHSETELRNTVSFNLSSKGNKVKNIKSLSYLTYHERLFSNISRDTWIQLAEYIDQQKHLYDPIHAVEDLALRPCNGPSLFNERPHLSGKIVLAEPIWAVPNLKRKSKWLHNIIRSTGLELEVIPLSDINEIKSVSEESDIIFIEEVIETPFDYGLYEWLVVSTGLRFSFDRYEMNQHLVKVRSAINMDAPFYELMKIEKELRSKSIYLPLFSGYEELLKTQQFEGEKEIKTGYIDFTQLWIDT